MSGWSSVPSSLRLSLEIFFSRSASSVRLTHSGCSFGSMVRVRLRACRINSNRRRVHDQANPEITRAFAKIREAHGDRPVRALFDLSTSIPPISVFDTNTGARSTRVFGPTDVLASYEVIIRQCAVRLCAVDVQLAVKVKRAWQGRIFLNAYNWLH